MKSHKVKQGECLSQIARLHGFTDLEYVWGHNPDLREKRSDWNVLFPGDIVNIPPLRVQKLSAVTNKRHVYMLEPVVRRLKLVIQDQDWDVVGGADFVIEVLTKTIRGKTGSDGSLDVEIPFSATQAKLTVSPRGRQMTWNLSIGHLNPVNDTPDCGVSGIQQRLNNLGLFHGDVSGKYCRDTEQAVRHFQEIVGLEVTGDCDATTIREIRDSRHGVRIRK